MNMIYLYGGHVQLPIVKEEDIIILQRRTIYGAEDRINIEELHDNVKLYSDNFFEYSGKNMMFVYSKWALHREEYADIPMYKKIDALKKTVKDDCLMYLEYLMWNDVENTEVLNPNQYFKQCEMQTYFKGWLGYSIFDWR